MLRCTLLGVGAMASPRFKPAGMVVATGRRAIMLDGGPGAEPLDTVDAWLVSDERAELMAPIRRLAAARGLSPSSRGIDVPGLAVEALPVVHTTHPTLGYRIRDATGVVVVWAPEFFCFPEWAAGADLMFAEGAGWDRPIRFARGAGGHAALLEVSRAALNASVRRLVFAHLGRPTIRALDAGGRPSWGEIGIEGALYTVRPNRD